MVQRLRPSRHEYMDEVTKYMASVRCSLADINKKIHSKPETAWKEHAAHDNICDMLERLGFDVTRHAYGLATAFEVSAGDQGPLINFNAEYDALPGIGHACGHNLIATSSLGAFLAVAHVIKSQKIPGRVVCLGTPAEELGGGKIALLDAGAYKDVTASLMVHPYAESDITDGPGYVGTAGMTSLAVGDLHATFLGKSSHAAAYPWDGVNALDAIVSSYNNVSMLRQQIRPEERIHGCIDEAPKFSNAIPHFTKMSYSCRSGTMERQKVLEAKVRACLEAGALGTGCSVELSTEPTYANLLINDSLCTSFQENMGLFGHKISKKWSGPGAGSTDQGNVSHAIPALHGVVAIPCAKGSHPHHQSFTEAAGAEAAFDRFLDAAKAMALTALDLITDRALRERMDKEFKHSSPEA